MDYRLARKGPSGPFVNLSDDYSRALLKPLLAPVTLTAGAGYAAILSTTISPLYGDLLVGEIICSADVETGAAGVVIVSATVNGVVATLEGVVEAPAGVVAKFPVEYRIPIVQATSVPLAVVLQSAATTTNGTINDARIVFSAFGRWSYV